MATILAKGLHCSDLGSPGSLVTHSVPCVTISTGAICGVWVRYLGECFLSRVPSKEVPYEPVTESVA
jgi:hypothetical protein